MVKVIASTIRKGNILEVEGRLYAVLSAESFFPGKGTPTTQIDMRRLSDGVKTTQRYAHLAPQTLLDASNAATLAVGAVMGVMPTRVIDVPLVMAG